jgi:hypothetical protein
MRVVILLALVAALCAMHLTENSHSHDTVFAPTAKCIKVLALIVGNKNGKLTYRLSDFDGTCDKYSVDDKDGKCMLSAKCLDDRRNWRNTTYRVDDRLITPHHHRRLIYQQ